MTLDLRSSQQIHAEIHPHPPTIQDVQTNDNDSAMAARLLISYPLRAKLAQYLMMVLERTFSSLVGSPGREKKHNRYFWKNN